MSRTVLKAVAALLLLCTAARADYLEVRRSATIKDHPARGAVALEQPAIGATLPLLDEGGQQNGYYHVIAPGGQHGWIYRTLVLRHEGSVAQTSAAASSVLPGEGLSGPTMKLHVVNVGQGNSALLEFSCGAILIDAGGDGKAATDHLIDYLGKFFASHPELNKTIATIFVTHTHIDHNSSLDAVIDHFTVLNYVHNGITTGSGRKNANWMLQNAAAHHVNVEAVSEADVERKPKTEGLTDSAIDPLACPDVDPQIRVLAAPYADNPGWPQGAFDNGNNLGIVIRVDFGGSSFLFTGDYEEDAIETMVDRYRGTAMLDVDVYHVGHHGSDNGTTEDLLTAMTPKIALISMGDTTSHKTFSAWGYGHPRQSTVELLDKWIETPRASPKWVLVAERQHVFNQYQMKHAVYATGWDGDVVVAADANSHFTVTTAH